MRSFVFAIIALFTFGFANNIQAQTETNVKESSILLNPQRPSVYIQSIPSSNKDDLIWLKLYNNSRWTISFCSAESEKHYGDVRIVYEVKKTAISGRAVLGRNKSDLLNRKKQKLNDKKQKEAELPDGFGTGDTCTPFDLTSGKSVSFTIPRNHLVKNFYIEIEFWYEWENRENELGNYPMNSVTFSNNSL